MTAEPPTKTRGRPLKFRPEFPELAMQFCRLGACNDDLAVAFKVSPACIDIWIAKRPDFAAAVKEGRQLADARVASALYSRAVGYISTETIPTVLDGELILSQVAKHHPPDIWACSLWLRNRRPDLWKDPRVIPSSPREDHDMKLAAARRIMAADAAAFSRILEEEISLVEEVRGGPRRTEGEMRELARSMAGSVPVVTYPNRTEEPSNMQTSAHLEPEDSPAAVTTPPEPELAPQATPEPAWTPPAEEETNAAVLVAIRQQEALAQPPPPDFRELLGLPPRRVPGS
ncbi:hypothetical protein [Luteolibacter sp. Populi]|uniref:hypothetical protein n=1 Tax=Luteolibacter sp. Populi TaxID=3230487 RepID=UPI00346701B1